MAEEKWYELAPGYSALEATGDWLGEVVNQVKAQYSPAGIAKAAAGEAAKTYTATGGKVSVDAGSLLLPAFALGGLILVLTLKRK